MFEPVARRRPIRYFLSYAHADEADVERFLAVFTPQLDTSAEFEFKLWSDRNIRPGEGWKAEIEKAVSDCAFGLLLVSPAFLRSPFIVQEELPLLLKKAIVVPVGLHRVLFDGSMDLKGMAERQLFLDSKRRTFDACGRITGRRDFVLELFASIHSQLIAAQGQVDQTPTTRVGRRPSDGLLSVDATPAEDLRIKYWTAFRSFLEDHQSPLRPQKPSLAHWYSFSVGTSRAHTAALVIARDRKVRVELSLRSGDAKILFARLLAQRENIETIVGSPLNWREMPDRKASRVCVDKAVDLYDEGDWPQQFAWLQNMLEKFDEAFRQALSNRSGAHA
jgi:hypothetical protein